VYDYGKVMLSIRLEAKAKLVASNRPHLVVITGMSGAGKTQAVRALEDSGFFCIDNLPPILVPKFVELLNASNSPLQKVALVMDIRGGQFFQALEKALAFLNNNYPYEMLFLDASDEALVRRFKETRRKHPLLPDRGVLEGIIEERKRLEPLRGLANKIIDTSELTPKQLKQQVVELFADDTNVKIVISIISFGYKYGIPLDADLVIDVRFLPNPFYVKELRNLTGEDEQVQDYVLNSTETNIFLKKFAELLNFLIPYYIKEGKTHLVVAIGCTGGQHRSVTLANKIGSLISNPDCKVIIAHRDIKRNVGKGTC